MDFELKNITVNCEIFGQGRPIIMLHGWTVDHRMMMGDMEPLFRKRDRWKRIYLDLPGHGRTPGKDWITNQDKMLDVILEFIDNVIPGQRFVIAGTSAGAYLARGVAYHRSALIDGILLTVPVVVADDAKRQLPFQLTLIADPVLVSELASADVDGFVQMAVVQNQKMVDYWRANISPDGEADTVFQEKLRKPENYAFSFDVDSLDTPCPAPTLIVTGRQDSIVGYRDAWNILENYPRGTFVILDRSGHLMQVEQEDLYHALVGEWLNRVEEFAGELG